MANQEHLDILKQGVDVWNEWKDGHVHLEVDLSEADLSRFDLRQINLVRANLIGANLSGANLSGANLNGSYLYRAELFNAHLDKAELLSTNLNKANLSEAYCHEATFVNAHLVGAKLNGTYLYKANLWSTDLTEADLSGANLISARLVDAKLANARLIGANLSGANLSGANLSEANLKWANLSEANLTKADLTGCFIYAISAWNVQLQETTQSSLIITRQDEPTITVDNLKVAQFIYLLLNNQEIRDVIDTITSKVVLILGRFREEHKLVLDALRDELRKQDYLPVLFDFDKPSNRDLTETVSILAHLARFIIVDLTDPSSVPHEVATVIPQTVVPVLPLLTLQPLIVDGKAVKRREYAMFEDLRRRYHWVLPTFRYQDTADLLVSLQEHIIESAEKKVRELAIEKAKKLESP